MRAASLVVTLGAALLVALVAAGRVLGGDEKEHRGHRAAEAPRHVLIASEDACQQVTAPFPFNPDAEATVFHGPFFLTYLAPGDPVTLVTTVEGQRDPLVLGELRELKGGERIFIPANTWVVARKGGSSGRLYSGFRPYAER